MNMLTEWGATEIHQEIKIDYKAVEKLVHQNSSPEPLITNSNPLPVESPNPTTLKIAES